MTKQKNIIIMMLAFLMLLPLGSAAQEVVQKLDSLQILIGEQTKLHLKVTAAKGAKVVEMDLTRTDVSYAVTEAFRCGRIVLACATYDGFLFPPMENLLTHLKTKNFQGRTVGLMENGTWAPMAAKLMRAELDGMKNITVCDAVVTIRSAANAAAEAQMDALADELLAK